MLLEVTCLTQITLLSLEPHSDFIQNYFKYHHRFITKQNYGHNRWKDPITNTQFH